MRGERGSALVQVLMMSILLIILATGLMQVVFMNHTALARVHRSDRYKGAAEACLAFAQASLGGASTCSGVPSNICSSMNVNTYTGANFSVSCAGGALQVTVTDNTW